MCCHILCTLTLLSKVFLLFFVQSCWPSPGVHTHKTISMTPNKSARDAQNCEQQAHHENKVVNFLAFSPTLSNYFRQCKHLHIYSLKQHSRIYFSIKGNNTFKSLKKNLKAKSKWAGLYVYKTYILKQLFQTSSHEYFHLASEQNGWFNKWSTGVGERHWVSFSYLFIYSLELKSISH